MSNRLVFGIDCSDPGLAANAIARATVLFARTCGMLADNEQRKREGYAPAFLQESFEVAIEELFPEGHSERRDDG